MNIQESAQAAKDAARIILTQSADTRTRALEAVSQALFCHADAISYANANDIARSEQEKLVAPLMKRLKFEGSHIERCVDSISTLSHLPDPMGRVCETRELDDGLILSRVQGPIGVIGMIFESRPDALVQMATLCLRSGNAVILKGGSEARESNRVLTEIIREASKGKGIPEGWIQLAETRDDVRDMLTLNSHIDLIIPRGSNEFVAHIMRESTIPVLGHADGICHVYVDAKADILKTIPIVMDSKMQYVAVCNAVETLLVHEEIAPNILPSLKTALESASCRLLGCARTQKYIDVEFADEKEWSTEYLDAILAIRVVGNMDEAIEHIHRYGSGHTDVIVTEDEQAAEEFLRRVDSADVFHNCSSRFSDGFVFGLGAEVGISTSKIHARGPVGVEGLLSYRWQLRGKGHIIADYNDGKKRFTHKNVIL